MNNLKSMNIWVCWNYVNKGGKVTKVPIAANGKKTGANALYRHTWVTYIEAADAAKEKNYSGIGFVIPEGFFFLDLDDKDLDDPYVQTMLERFATYAEMSPSGNGIHILGRCKLSKLPVSHNEESGEYSLDSVYYMKNPNNGTELYIGGVTNRFATYTGNAVNEQALEDCTLAVLETLVKDMRKPEKDRPKSAATDTNYDMGVDEITNGLREQKNGEKFRKLYDNGDCSDYTSASEADVALCAMIAFRTGPDCNMVDTIFRSSALMREKWEREDYRKSTINAGIEACHGVFYESGKKCPDFVCIDEKTNKRYISPQLLAAYVREHLQYIFVRDNGKQGIRIYVYQNGVYQLYAEDMFKGAIKQFVVDYDERLLKMRDIDEVYRNLTTDLKYVNQRMLNSDETIINFRNGLLKVTATEVTLMPHTPDVLSTIQIPCDWTGNQVPTPVFDQYIGTLTNNDKEIILLLLEVMGVVISNVKAWRMKKSLFMLGEGNTGKSVLKRFVERMLGDTNYNGADLSQIEARFGTGTIYGTRLAGSSDMSFLSVNELKTFKKLTGGDSVFAEFKGKQPFEYTYDGFLWFCMNRLPKFSGDDGQWVYDRIMVVKCENSIPWDKQDKMLSEKLDQEREGIVYQVIKALQKVIKDGYRFSETNSMLMARKEYLEDNNSAIAFIKMCMYVDMNGKENPQFHVDRVYHAYKEWCKDYNNGYSKSLRDFQDSIVQYLGQSNKSITKYEDIRKRVNGRSYFRFCFLTQEAIYNYGNTR